MRPYLNPLYLKAGRSSINTVSSSNYSIFGLGIRPSGVPGFQKKFGGEGVID